MGPSFPRGCLPFHRCLPQSLTCGNQVPFVPPTGPYYAPTTASPFHFDPITCLPVTETCKWAHTLQWLFLHKQEVWSPHFLGKNYAWYESWEAKWLPTTSDNLDPTCWHFCTQGMSRRLCSLNTKCEFKSKYTIHTRLRSQRIQITFTVMTYRRSSTK